MQKEGEEIKNKKINTKNGTNFIIDYDLPAKKKCRARFYRKLKDPKYKGKRKSTKSVITTSSPAGAKAIFNLAANCGSASLYQVKRLKKKTTRAAKKR